MRTRITAGVVLGLVVIGLAATGFLILVYADRHGPGSGVVKAVDLPPGVSPETLAAELFDRGVVVRPRLWALYARLRGAGGRFRTGRVLLRDSMSARQVLQRVAEGFGHAEIRITVPEGYDRFDVAQLLDRWGICEGGDFLRETKNTRLLAEYGIDASSAEGYLFPDTYRMHDGLGARRVVRRLIDNWRRRIDPLLKDESPKLAALKRDAGWGVHQILVLASIVEKEAALPGERPVIAGVFLNRLLRPEFRPRRLQADPTVGYGCRIAPKAAPSCAGYEGGPITLAMVADPANAYNTYRHEGLPPGPISNPGIDSIRSVLGPARHDYFYFVVDAGGRHRFSETLEEHNRAVDAYRRSSNP